MLPNNWTTEGVWVALNPCPNRCVTAAVLPQALKLKELYRWIGERIIEGRGVKWRPNPQEVSLVDCQCAVVVHEPKEATPDVTPDVTPTDPHVDAKLNEAIATLRARCPKAGSQWRHTKTGHIYAVSTGCVIEATLTPAVSYYLASTWPPGGLVWIRPLEEFLQKFTEVTDDAHTPG